MQDKYKERKHKPSHNQEKSINNIHEESDEHLGLEQLNQDADVKRKQKEIKNSTIGGF